MSNFNAVFLYAGQGSQKVGMGKDFYDNFEEYRKFFDQTLASLNLDFDPKKLMFEGPIEELSKTEYTQSCMALHAAALTHLLKMSGVTPKAAGGLSLGEYGALYAAEVFDAKEYVEITAFRGRVMMEAAKGIECSMSAILGLDPKTIEEECSAYSDGYVTVANYNCPGQTVICGEEKAVAAVEASLKDKGAKRCVRLNVSGPFHTKFMKPAGDRLEELFKKMDFKTPKLPVALNVTGQLCTDEDIKEMLVKQVQSSVRMEEDLRRFLENGEDTFVEIGPGNTVSGFLKKTARDMKKDVKIYSIDTISDFDKLLGEL